MHSSGAIKSYLWFINNLYRICSYDEQENTLFLFRKQERVVVLTCTNILNNSIIFPSLLHLHTWLAIQPIFILGNNTTHVIYKQNVKCTKVIFYIIYPTVQHLVKMNGLRYMGFLSTFNWYLWLIVDLAHICITKESDMPLLHHNITTTWVCDKYRHNILKNCVNYDCV